MSIPQSCPVDWDEPTPEQKAERLRKEEVILTHLREPWRTRHDDIAGILILRHLIDQLTGLPYFGWDVQNYYLRKLLGDEFFTIDKRHRESDLRYLDGEDSAMICRKLFPYVKRNQNTFCPRTERDVPFKYSQEIVGCLAELRIHPAIVYAWYDRASGKNGGWDFKRNLLPRPDQPHRCIIC